MSSPLGRLRSGWTHAAGGWMHVRQGAVGQGGDAPAVVLVHGSVISSSYMAPTARMLAPSCCVYAPDLPGFGWSFRPPRALDVPGMAGALAAWMDAIGLPEAVLIGNSLGCQVVAELAVRFPSRVTRAVLVAPTIDPSARTFPRQLARWLMDCPLEHPSLGLLLLRDCLLSGPFRLVPTIRHMLRDRIEEKLPRMGAPTLVVRGGRDPIVPQRWAEEAAGMLPDGRLVVLPGGAHCLNYSSPERLVRVVRPFVEAGSTGAAGRAVGAAGIG